MFVESIIFELLGDGDPQQAALNTREGFFMP